MAVLDPLKVTITNYPEDQVEQLIIVNNPENEADGEREVPFSRELYIERTDFMEDAPKKFFRLAPGRDVRLKGAYIIRCDEVIKNEAGEATELKCSYYPNSKSGQDESGVKVKGTIHWVSIPHAVQAEVRLYDRLFLKEDPLEVEAGETFIDNLNPDSIEIIENAFVEPYLDRAKPETSVQFIRNGYFTVDRDSTTNLLVFNRTVGLRDSWAKSQKK